MTPFKLQPAFKDYLWGGTRLKTDFGKGTGLGIVAESWELSAHEDGPSVIATGPNTGKTLAAFIHEHPEALGSRCKGANRLPILIKLIDAKQALSIQVHPDDRYAQRVEGEPGKTEMWVVLDAEPGAYLYFGFKENTTREEAARRIKDGTLTDILHKAPVKPGDVFFIPAGTIHAIGAGIVIAEIQQNSNTTYRVFDYGRRDANGCLRELHVEKALDVTCLAPADSIAPGAGTLQDTVEVRIDCLADCAFFKVLRLDLQNAEAGDTGLVHTLNIGAESDSFLALLCVDGNATLECKSESLHVTKGDCIFFPAGSERCDISGGGQFLLASV